MRNRKQNSQAGFSLVELLLVVAIFTIIMAALVTQIDTAQKRYRAEEQKTDTTQESREFVDQMARDLHQVGYPNTKMYTVGVLAATPDNDPRNAVGLVKFAYDEVGFEGDVDGDGLVDSVNYRLVPYGGAGACPCRIERSQVVKPAAPPFPQTIQGTSRWGLQDVVNSGGANNGATGVGSYTISGYTHGGVSNDAVYGMYKNANLFTAYDSTGAVVVPADFATNKALLKTIRTIKINVNVLTGAEDMQSSNKPAVTIAASVRIPAN